MVSRCSLVLVVWLLQLLLPADILMIVILTADKQINMVCYSGKGYANC